MPTTSAHTPPSLGPAAGWRTLGGFAALVVRVKVGGATMGRSTACAGGAGEAAGVSAALAAAADRAWRWLTSVACISRDSMREWERPALSGGSSRVAEATSVEAEGENPTGPPDRKSTRLNSSH